MSKEIKIRIKIPTINLQSINFWKITTILFLALFLISVYGNVSGFFARVNGFTSSNSDPEKIKKDVIDFINQYLVQAGTKAEAINISDKGAYYEILTVYQGNQIPVYVSKDGKMLFLDAINMEEFRKIRQQAQQTQSQQNIPKKERPEFKVFIMSYCPFGIQAVKALLPVMKLLGDKADITVHFVNYIMHGEKEVWENLREYCIQRDQREKFYDYMLCFVQSGDYEKCIKEANVDVDLLQSCMNELDKKYNITGILQDRSKWQGGIYPPFPIEDELNVKYGVRGSPTIVINDVVVRLNRSPEAFKDALCNAFVNPPKECNEKLSTEIASPGIGPLTGGSNIQASCG